MFLKKYFEKYKSWTLDEIVKTASFVSENGQHSLIPVGKGRPFVGIRGKTIELTFPENYRVYVSYINSVKPFSVISSKAKKLVLSETDMAQDMVLEWFTLSSYREDSVLSTKFCFTEPSYRNRTTYTLIRAINRKSHESVYFPEVELKSIKQDVIEIVGSYNQEAAEKLKKYFYVIPLILSESMYGMLYVILTADPYWTEIGHLIGNKNAFYFETYDLNDPQYESFFKESLYKPVFRILPYDKKFFDSCHLPIFNIDISTYFTTRIIAKFQALQAKYPSNIMSIYCDETGGRTAGVGLYLMVENNQKDLNGILTTGAMSAFDEYLETLMPDSLIKDIEKGNIHPSVGENVVRFMDIAFAFADFKKCDTYIASNTPTAPYKSFFYNLSNILETPVVNKSYIKNLSILYQDDWFVLGVTRKRDVYLFTVSRQSGYIGIKINNFDFKAIKDKILKHYVKRR